MNKILSISLASITLLLSVFNNNVFSENNLKISKDKINGIYRVKDVFSPKIVDFYAICKNKQYVKVAIKSLNYYIDTNKSERTSISQPRLVEIKEDIKYWTPSSNDFLLFGSENKVSGSIEVKDNQEFIINYIRVYDNEIAVSLFFSNTSDFTTVSIGSKEFEEFNIIDEKTNKILEICKSR